jgi:hypothetical protein
MVWEKAFSDESNEQGIKSLCRCVGENAKVGKEEAVVDIPYRYGSPPVPYPFLYRSLRSAIQREGLERSPGDRWDEF